MKQSWRCLVASVLLTGSAVACRPLTSKEEPASETIPPAAATAVQAPAAATFPRPTGAPPTGAPPTAPLPPAPAATAGTLAAAPAAAVTASPTVDRLAGWQTAGDTYAGWQVAIPPGWIRLAGALPPAQTTTPLGLITLLAANSERTGASLLAGKPVTAGAFVVGLVATDEPLAAPPADGLAQWLSRADNVTLLQEITPLSTAGGAAATVAGHPVPAFDQAAPRLRTEILYLRPDAASSVQVVLMLSAPPGQWSGFAPLFADIARSARLRPPARASDVTSPLRGRLSPPAPTSSYLSRGAPDYWTLTGRAEQYLSLRLQPDGDNLDLAASVVAPSGLVLVQLDNGYTNHTERIIDLRLPETGHYLVVVHEFAGRAGPYTLTTELSTQPLFDGRGQILQGESVQSQLDIDGRHLWTFSGQAGQRVSVVVMPQSDTLDAILNLYGPDGTRLVALDEGFSGDPELFSSFRLPLTGAYTIVVSNFAGAGGTYALSLEEGEETTTNFYDAGDLAYGQSRRETLQAGEAHAWFFQATAADEVLIRLTPLADDLDLDLWLVDPNISLVATEDGLLAGEPESLQQVLTVTGQYTILVREYGGRPGGYEIELMPLPTAAPVYAGAITAGETVSGTLTAGQADYWLFDGQVGMGVEMIVQPAAATDLVLQLQAPTGQIVWEVDAAAAGLPEIIAGYQLMSAGQWRLLIQEFYGAAAGYTLSLETAN